MSGQSPENPLADLFKASRVYSKQENKQRSVLRYAEKWAKVLGAHEGVPVGELINVLMRGANNVFRHEYPGSIAGDLHILPVKQEFESWFSQGICPLESPWSDALYAAEEDSSAIIACCPVRGAPYAITLRGPPELSMEDAPECPHDGARLLCPMVVIPSFGLQRFYMTPIKAFGRLYCRPCGNR